MPYYRHTHTCLYIHIYIYIILCRCGSCAASPLRPMLREIRANQHMDELGYFQDGERREAQIEARHVARPIKSAQIKEK